MSTHHTPGADASEPPRPSAPAAPAGSTGRTGTTAVVTTVDYLTVDGTAEAGIDFTPATGTVEFQIGENVARHLSLIPIEEGALILGCHGLEALDNALAGANALHLPVDSAQVDFR